MKLRLLLQSYINSENNKTKKTFLKNTLHASRGERFGIEMSHLNWSRMFGISEPHRGVLKEHRPLTDES